MRQKLQTTHSTERIYEQLKVIQCEDGASIGFIWQWID